MPDPDNQPLTPEAHRLLTAAWAKIAQQEEVFQYPKSDADTLEGVFKDFDMGFVVEDNFRFTPQDEYENVVQKWNITTADGRKAFVYRKGNGDIWVNVADLRSTESRGSAFYAAVLNYAYNTQGRLIGDAAGVSDEAIFRRTENMISSALKFGTTKHMLPAREQQHPGLYVGTLGHTSGVTENFVPLAWSNNDLENLANLLKVSHAHISKLVPEVQNAYVDFNTGNFYWQRKTAEGQVVHRPVERGDFERMSRALQRALGSHTEGMGSDDAIREDLGSSGDARRTRGSATLQRAIITSSLLRAARSQDRGRSELAAIGSELRRRMERAGQGTAETGSYFSRILYSLARTEETVSDLTQDATPGQHAPGEGDPAANFKLSKEERAAQRSFDFGDKPNYGGHTAATLQERKERNEPAPEEPALEAAPRGADHIAARVLNWALARKFDNPDWRNAYTAASLPEGMAALQADFEAAFGRTIHPVMPTADRFNSFGGVYLTDQPGKVFVNVRRAHETGFLQLAGHELLHDLKRDRPDLYHWFVAQADQYLTNVEDYRQRLNVLSEENGIAAHSLQSAKEELIADFTGDALADTQFLGQLAKSDSNRFTSLVQSVSAWFDKLGAKLRGRGMKSAQHVKDVDGLRKHLSEVLIAYVNKQDIRQLPSYQAQAKERAAAFEVMLHHDRNTNELVAHKKGDDLKRPLKRWTVPEGTAAGKYATEVVFPWIRENRAELVAAWEGAKFSQQPNEPEPLVSKAQPDEECARILQGEAVASVSKRDAVQAAHKGALAKELKKLFAEKFEGQAVRAGLGTVLLDDQAAEDSAAHSDVRNEYKMATFAAAKDVIEQGGVIAHALHGGIHSYYIAAPVLVDGVRHVMTAHVRRTKEQRLYLHSIRLEANLLQQETKENLSTQGESWAAAVGYATGDTGSQAPRGSHNLPEGIHAGKLQHSELTARLRHLLTLDVQQTQDDNDIKLSLTRSPEREAAIDALLPAMSADEMVMYPLSETWPETLIDGVEDDEQAAVLHVLRTELARREPPMAHGDDRHEWAQRAANTREYARRVMRWSPKDARDDLRDGLRGYSADHMEFLGQFPREYWPRIDAAHRTHAGIQMAADGEEYHIWTKDFRIASARLRAIMDGDIVEARNVGEENHMERSKEFYKQVAEKLIAQLESGTAPPLPKAGQPSGFFMGARPIPPPPPPSLTFAASSSTLKSVLPLSLLAA